MPRVDAEPRQADLDLRRRVVNFLSQLHFPGLRNLKVEANGGVVTIRGRVNSFHERQLCIQCCGRVAGVVRLVDRVEVAQEPKESRSLLAAVDGLTGRVFAPSRQLESVAG